jgi:hypothetical protein
LSRSNENDGVEHPRKNQRHGAGDDIVGILMTQRVMDSPVAPPTLSDFWTSAYQAIGD